MIFLPKGKLLVTVRSANSAFPVNGSRIEIVNEEGALILDEILGEGASGISKTVDFDTPKAFAA